MTILSFDPGQSGGIATRHHDGLTDARKMPETLKDICDLITYTQVEAAENHSPMKAYIEKVGGYTGGEGTPGSAMFGFGEGYGAIKGILTALGIPFELVAPQKWISGLSLGTKGLQRAVILPSMTPAERKVEKKRISQLNGRLKTVWKNKLKERAQQAHPHLHVTLATADALLLLEHACKQERVGMVAPQPKLPTL